ncbi:efflux RND transporter periplasmic adaptor subunit [Aggregicoccus sp. 17bor-14]|uniref:efflux RND transporter periplasmic adaptor subunit n=1 Tax=Myxococcaceae TaxID=31 RepID=UPI00129C4A02|nr:MULTISPECIES: efflux RND transporter periplasmic adaptor subunit [Myxococcaceae]MBF5046165.1 efflux RND transporter periplasmic adaptor subunit [Simulacricoccus sp. 17bor-14]MRI91890.1 efflux RND transporter periplasmic adaptor subunit [Aggregicoccus sp. 17bor-14]
MSSLPPSSRPALSGLLVGLALALGCHGGGGGGGEGGPGGGGGGPPQGMPPPAVTVVTLHAGPVMLTRELPGRTNPFLVAEVRPQVNGIVEKRLFTEGGVVKAGQPLYQLDDSTYRAEHASAQAQLERAQATLTQQELNAKRAGELARMGSISTAEHERAEATFRQAQADVKAAQAAVQRTAVTLSYARIVSPISGRIGKSSVTQGALVTANQPQALATVQQLDPIYVDLTQSSAELLELRKAVAAGTLERADSAPVTVLLEDGSRYSHQGKLAFSDVTVDPGTGSYSLRVQVPNPDNVLLPGMYVRALVGNGVREQGLLVPQQGVARDPKGDATALVVNKEGKVEPRVVKASRTVGDKWLVDSGLVDGDRVIVEGLQKVQPGMPVQATEAASAPAEAQGGPPAGPAAGPGAGRGAAAAGRGAGPDAGTGGGAPAAAPTGK